MGGLGGDYRDGDRDYEDDGWGRIIVVASTNRIDAVPRSLRRPGRFDREICFGPPGRDERLGILTSLLAPYRHGAAPGDDGERGEGDGGGGRDGGLSDVAADCVGYVAADLAALVRGAATLGLRRRVGAGVGDDDDHDDVRTTAAAEGRGGGGDPEEGRDDPLVTPELLRLAMPDAGASALRDSAVSAPPAATWDDVAGDAGGAKGALRRAVEWPRTRRRAFAALGLVPPRGVLLHGPPGCAKTTLARAAAGAAGVSFISLSPADLARPNALLTAASASPTYDDA